MFGRLLFFGNCAALFVYAIVRFAEGGAFGSETTTGVGRTLAVANALMLIFVLANLLVLLKAPGGVKVVSVWLAWVVLTCLHFREEGVTVLLLAVLSVSYCPLHCLFFFVALRRYSTWQNLTVATFVLLLVMSAFLFLAVFQYRNMSAVHMAQLNPVYYLLLLLPWVLLCRKAWWRYAGVALIAYAVMWSMKRTAVVSFVGAITVYFLCEHYRLRKLINWRWLTAIVVVSCVLVQMWKYVGRETEGYLSFRFYGIADDRGSGRLDIFRQVFALQASSSVEGWIMGHGQDGVRQASSKLGGDGKSAHNDWQETLYDFGIVGLFLYVLIHIALLALTLRLVRRRSQLGSVMAGSYALFLLMSSVSHLVLYPSYFSYLMALWGTIWAVTENERHAPTAIVGSLREMRLIGGDTVFVGNSQCGGQA